MKLLAKISQRDFRMLVAGAGPEESWLREQARHLDGKMLLVGHLDKESLADHYANADIFLHPNPREPFGNVGLEAMASGAACVMPDSGGVLTYCDAHNSWLAKADAKSFAEAIIEAAEDDVVRRSKTLKARETAEHHSEDDAVDLLFATYDRMYRTFCSNGGSDAARPSLANDARGQGFLRRTV
jgi:glycosyltransferase involved in cell wall biosynthesis